MQREQSPQPNALDYAPVGPPRQRWLPSVVLCFGPMAAVALTICLELAYVSACGSGISGGVLPPVLKWAALLEVSLLVVALANVLVMHWHLSRFRIYSAAPWFIKLPASVLMGSLYLAAIAALFWFVLLIHLV